MKVRYNFFCMVIGWLHFPYLSQAVALSNQPIVSDFSNSVPRLLQPRQHGYHSSSASKVDEAELLRKTMRIEAMVQRSWISSMVVPGLGQVYNKDYWKVPCFYLGFALVGARIYAEHQEMNNHKRTLLMDSDGKLNPAFTEKRIQECERTRNLFIIIASAWYLLSILDAYAGGHNQTVNFKDDIGTKPTEKSTTLLQPTATSSTAKHALP